MPATADPDDMQQVLCPNIGASQVSVYIDGFDTFANTYCIIGAAQKVPLPFSAGNLPKERCSIALFERPLFQDIGGVQTIVGEHTYVYATDKFLDGSNTVLNFLCEGGAVGGIVGGTLQGGCTSSMNTPAVKDFERDRSSELVWTTCGIVPGWGILVPGLG
jgi:hypothetical protein